MTDIHVPSLRVKSGQGDYDVHFEASWDGLIRRVATIPNAVLLADKRVVELYGEVLRPMLASLPTLLVEATEENKTLAGVTQVVSWMQQQNCTKQSALVCLGGGIIQDLATFSSHLYYRGIKWVHLPTTLLSMSDSCIGAKCGINLSQHKNQLGVFQAPAQVVIAPTFVETLSDRDVASGHGEILKLLLTGPEDYYTDYERVVAGEGLRTPQLSKLIFRSLGVKRGVIEADEYETDRRRILNYGHTFGHVLEALSGYEIPHGLGVAWGMDIVNYIAMKRGLLEPAWFSRVHAFIGAHLPFTVRRTPSAAELIAGTKRDKKVEDGQVNLVLLERPGVLRIVKTAYTQDLTDDVSEYLQRYDVHRH